jgi:hypothetical protein
MGILDGGLQLHVTWRPGMGKASHKLKAFLSALVSAFPFQRLKD